MPHKVYGKIINAIKQKNLQNHLIGVIFARHAQD